MERTGTETANYMRLWQTKKLKLTCIRKYRHTVVRMEHSVRMKLWKEQSVVHERVAALDVAHGVAAVLASHVPRGVLAGLDAAPDHLMLGSRDVVSVQADKVDSQFGVVPHNGGEPGLGGGVLLDLKLLRLHLGELCAWWVGVREVEGWRSCV